MQTKWVRVRRERISAQTPPPEWPVAFLGPREHLGPMNNNATHVQKHPGQRCLAPGRPNPSRRATYVNCCCITTRLHGTDERVPRGVKTFRRTLASKPASIEQVQVRYGSTSSGFTKRGVLCLFHEARSQHHAPANKCSPPSLKSIHRWHRPAGPLSCFMGEMADCRFTRQHPSGQLTAGRYPPVSVDVALVALTSSVGQNEQRSRLVTCGRRKNA